MIDYFETKSQPITMAMVLKAYGIVRANKGGAGIDGINWAELDANLQGHLYRLLNRLSSGSYFPAPVLQVEIPKKSGGVRPLGIPTLLDRIAVVCYHLEKQLEPLFHESSFGYRPGRSAHDAVAQSQRNYFNHDFAIDLDIKSYFDTIEHYLMMKAHSHYCKDKWVQMYVERWLKSGHHEGRKAIDTESGYTPGWSD
jgi:RNA-directed DNA polymerase